MKKFTVILMRPESVSETYGQDVYFAHVEAKRARFAVQPALSQVVEADKDLDLDLSDEDYTCVAVLDGHVTPALFGWQL